MTFTAHSGQIYSASTQRPFPSGLAKQTNESWLSRLGGDTYLRRVQLPAPRGGKGEGTEREMCRTVTQQYGGVVLLRSAAVAS